MYIYSLKFPFFIVRMPHLSSNIPSSIFYESGFSEILRVARCTLPFSDFTPRISELLTRMINQGGNIKLLIKQIRKAYQKYPGTFHKFQKSENELVYNLGY